MTHESLHLMALSLSQVIRDSEIKLFEVLMKMRDQNSFIALGYTGVWDYCTRAL